MTYAAFVIVNILIIIRGTTSKCSPLKCLQTSIISSFILRKLFKKNGFGVVHKLINALPGGGVSLKRLTLSIILNVVGVGKVR